jgi:RNA polymerase sigma-70 factor (ECF subfamily)
MGLALDIAAFDRGEPAVAEAPSVAELYREHAAFVWRTLRRLGIPDADVDDAAHEVFMVAFRKRDTLWDRRYARSWLFGIARRVARHTRRTLDRRPAPLDRAVSTADGPESQVARAQAVELARTALDGMDVRRRAVFVLSELEELSAPEVAAALSIPVNTVYSRLRKARAEFEQAIARLEGSRPWKS